MTTLISRIAVAGLLALATASTILAQTVAVTEIYSPYQKDGDKINYDREIAKKSCVSLITLQQGCGVRDVKISYGNRFGDNWDIFSISSPVEGDDRTRGKDLGMLSWDEQFNIPEIQPWPKLQPGERRIGTVNTSGADGRFADKPVDQQVTTAIKTETDVLPSNFSPFLQIQKGHIYAFHVVDEVNDFYLLLRIDDLVRGTKATISYKTVATHDRF